GQSFDIHSVSQAPIEQPAIPPINVNIRTGLTACPSASSISWRGIGEYTVKSVWPAPRNFLIASSVVSRYPNTPSTPGVGGGLKGAASDLGSAIMRERPSGRLSCAAAGALPSLH